MNLTSLGCAAAINYRIVRQERRTIRQIKAALRIGYKSADPCNILDVKKQLKHNREHHHA
jgi:hypothetical protein